MPVALQDTVAGEILMGRIARHERVITRQRDCDHHTSLEAIAKRKEAKKSGKRKNPTDPRRTKKEPKTIEAQLTTFINRSRVVIGLSLLCFSLVE